MLNIPSNVKNIDLHFIVNQQKTNLFHFVANLRSELWFLLTLREQLVSVTRSAEAAQRSPVTKKKQKINQKNPLTSCLVKYSPD